MSFYGNETKACLLSNSDILLASDEKLEMINLYIDTIINGNSFNEFSADEYYDFYKINQNELVLKKMPVISITELYSDANSDLPVLIDPDSYVFDSESGILQLINTKTISGNGISYFPVGKRIIRVKYVHGYASTPSDINNFATLLLARYLRMEEIMAENGILKSIKIGNYTETFGSTEQTPWDLQLSKLESRLVSYYSEGV